MGARGEAVVRTADRGDYGVLAGLLAAAFADDPFQAWLFPDRATRAWRQGRLFARVLDLYGHHGLVLAGAGRESVALWDPPRENGPGFLQTLRFVGRVLPALGRRSFAAAEAMAPLRELPPEGPHWYLSLLGTHPSARGRGLATALLLHVLDRCDADSLPACLEASRRENIAFYERFGFEVVAPLAMPSGPTIYRMLRLPSLRTRRSARAHEEIHR